jgi:putative redox protein
MLGGGPPAGAARIVSRRREGGQVVNDVTVRWVGGRRFVGTNDEGHSIVIGGPAEVGGDGSGMRPVELLLYGLAGCTAWDVVSILEKQRQAVTGIEVHVTGVQRDTPKPSAYTAIHATYTVTGIDVKPEFVARAIELSEEKYCSARASLDPAIAFSSSFEIVEDTIRTSPKE